MKILSEQPPKHILEMILKAGMQPTQNTVYTYGDTIFVPHGHTDLENHLIHHEEVHMKQQGSNPDAWWSRYMTDIYFRIEQEVEAYGAQYAFLCKIVKDRNRRNMIALDLARILSSPIYGSVITREDARKMIINKSNVK